MTREERLLWFNFSKYAAGVEMIAGKKLVWAKPPSLTERTNSLVGAVIAPTGTRVVNSRKVGSVLLTPRNAYRSNTTIHNVVRGEHQNVTQCL